MRHFTNRYESLQAGQGNFELDIKWSRNLKRRFEQKRLERFDKKFIVKALYQPFTKLCLYDSKLFIDERGAASEFFCGTKSKTTTNQAIALSGQSGGKAFQVIGIDSVADLHLIGDTQYFGLYRFDAEGNRTDNITDWGRPFVVLCGT